MIFKLIAVTLMLSACTSGPKLEECAHRIYFLPQTHHLWGDPRKEYAPDMRNTAFSQFKILKFIEQYRDIPVFSEQMESRDVFWNKLSAKSRNAFAAEFKKTFPNGVPETFDLLSERQRYELAYHGGEYMEFMAQRIPAIHRVISSEAKGAEILKPLNDWEKAHPGSESFVISNELERRMFNQREEAALEAVRDYFSANPKTKDILLVFGAAHNFSHYPEIFPSSCIAVPGPFRADWVGADRERNRSNFDWSM